MSKQRSYAATAEHIAIFARDLKNSLDMGDKKNSVKWLADKIGADDANKIAEVFGLWSDYYKIKE